MHYFYENIWEFLMDIPKQNIIWSIVPYYVKIKFWTIR